MQKNLTKQVKRITFLNIGFQLSLVLAIALFQIQPLYANTRVTPPPNIVVSITPFYALVAAVIKNTDLPSPRLLVRSGASPHQYALRPSDLQALHKANIILWAGPEYETFLARPLENLSQQYPEIKIITLQSLPKLIQLPLRQGTNWEPHKHGDFDDDHHYHHDHQHPNLVDMHFWLDPQNAIIMTDAIVNQLSLYDPSRSKIYEQNGRTLKEALHKLDLRLSQQLKSVQNIPFIVFHDAYQYFQYRYHLNIVGSITLHPDAPPSAKRISEIRSIIQKTKAKCIFSEPQFQPKLVKSLVDDLKIHTGELDPIGTNKQDNPDGYFSLLNNLADSIQQCLETDNPTIKK